MSDTKEISELVRATLESKIIEAFKSTPEMVDELVKASLNQEVNEYGGKPDYRDDTIPYLTYLARRTIQDIARKTVFEYCEEIEPMIKEQVREALNSVNLVNAFSKTISDSLKSSSYSMDVVFKYDDEN